MITTAPSSRNTNNPELPMVETGDNHGISAAAALYYPSLIGNSWDDELLPSGD